ncbi:hypothetical protein ACTXT7_001729, partial [Hymenolepis weldensis]
FSKQNSVQACYQLDAVRLRFVALKVHFCHNSISSQGTRFTSINKVLTKDNMDFIEDLTIPSCKYFKAAHLELTIDPLAAQIKSACKSSKCRSAASKSI